MRKRASVWYAADKLDEVINFPRKTGVAGTNLFRYRDATVFQRRLDPRAAIRLNGAPVYLTDELVTQSWRQSQPADGTFDKTYRTVRSWWVVERPGGR